LVEYPFEARTGEVQKNSLLALCLQIKATSQIEENVPSLVISFSTTFLFCPRQQAIYLETKRMQMLIRLPTIR